MLQRKIKDLHSVLLEGSYFESLDVFKDTFIWENKRNIISKWFGISLRGRVIFRNSMYVSTGIESGLLGQQPHGRFIHFLYLFKKKNRLREKVVCGQELEVPNYSTADGYGIGLIFGI